MWNKNQILHYIVIWILSTIYELGRMKKMSFGMRMIRSAYNLQSNPW